MRPLSCSIPLCLLTAVHLVRGLAIQDFSDEIIGGSDIQLHLDDGQDLNGKEAKVSIYQANHASSEPDQLISLMTATVENETIELHFADQSQDLQDVYLVVSVGNEVEESDTFLLKAGTRKQETPVQAEKSAELKQNPRLLKATSDAQAVAETLDQNASKCQPLLVGTPPVYVLSENGTISLSDKPRLEAPIRVYIEHGSNDMSSSSSGGHSGSDNGSHSDSNNGSYGSNDGSHSGSHNGSYGNDNAAGQVVEAAGLPLTLPVITSTTASSTSSTTSASSSTTTATTSESSSAAAISSSKTALIIAALASIAAIIF